MVLVSYLLLPAVQLLIEVVVALSDLGKLSVHASLKVDEVLPGLQSVPGVLIPLTNNLVEVSHRHLGHQRLLNCTTENSLDASVPAHLLADVIHDSHNSVLVPPLRVLDRFNLAAHDYYLTGWHQLASTVC